MNHNPFSQYPALILFYMLPKEFTDKAELSDFPRNPHEFIRSKKWQEVYRSDIFELLLLDGWAFLIWRHFGIKARMESFTGYDPGWKYAHAYPIWIVLLNRIYKTSSEDFLMYPQDTYIPFLTYEEADARAAIIADALHKYTHFDAVMKIVQEHRDFRDFQSQDTNLYKDFHRKYYHTRTRFKHSALDDTGGEHEQVAEVNFDIEDVDTPDWLEHFFHRLKQDKDIEIVKLLYTGLTQEQIAKRLGYANHSGVSKRIQYIREEMRCFLAEQEKAVYHPPEPKPSTVKYDVIPFSYKRTQ